MASYLVYWKPETVVAAQHLPSLKYSASKQYGKIRPGDVLWIVSSEEPDDLVLVGRQHVDRIAGEVEAKSLLGINDLWPADLYAISDSPEDKSNLPISRFASQLSFDGVVGELPQGFSGQHLQAIRRLDFDSAQLLERLWRDRDELFDT
jgi:hypothetical protein